MVVTAVMTVVCVAAIAFNVRFLVALRQERRSVANEHAILERMKRKKPLVRAA